MEQSSRGDLETQNFKALRKCWEASRWESWRKVFNFINIPFICNTEPLSQMQQKCTFDLKTKQKKQKCKRDEEARDSIRSSRPPDIATDFFIESSEIGSFIKYLN